MRGAVTFKPIPISREIASNVFRFLREKGFEVEIVEDFSNLDGFDFLVVVGGDGTILRVLQSLEDCPPIFGINTGKIGMLMHCEYTDYEEKIVSTLRSFEVEEFMRIECSIDGEVLLALNEIAILCSTPAKLVEMSVFVDGVKIDDLRCDGLLISTPVGSTAYALSTGGPIIDPHLESILIIPVAPFKLGWKPWVVCSHREIVVEFSRGVFVVADGQKTVEIKGEGVVKVKRSDKSAKFFKLDNRIGRIVKKLRGIC